MFDTNAELLEQDYSPKTALKESGCFKVKIEEAELIKGIENNSEGLRLNVETEEYEKATLTIFYKNQDGTYSDYGRGQITQILEILEIKKEDLNIKTNKNNKEIVLGLQDKKMNVAISFEGIKEKLNKETGEIFLSAKYILKAVFDENNLTTKEILSKNKIEVTAYEKWKTIFKKQNKKRLEIEKETREEIKKIKKFESSEVLEDDDDFPF